VSTGHPANAILLAAQEASADLIVMGTHRKQALRDVFIGTTIERIIRTGSLPVLMVNTAADLPYQRVMAALDASEPSVHAIKTAAALGLLTGRQLTLLHAFVAPGTGKLEVANVSSAQISAYVSGAAREAGAELYSFLSSHDVDLQPWTRRLEEGRAVEVISRVALQIMPDLIIIGTRGRAGLARTFLGSVAEEVLRLINHDILAVPPLR
jgi:nucleotide-binding universal stress UspA family protein